MTAAMRTSEVRKGRGRVVVLIYGRWVISIIRCELSDSVAFVNLGFSTANKLV